MHRLGSRLLAGVGRRLRHVGRAVAARPSRREWIEAAALFGGVSALALATGLRTRLVRPELMKAPMGMFLLVPSLLAMSPGITEEVVFRGLLLPHPEERARPHHQWGAALLSLAIFVLWHPFNGLRLRTERRHVFTDPRFLLQTVFLGAACSAAYLRSGSIWPPAVMHWLTVTAWIVTLGGHRHLREGVAGRAEG